MRALPVLMYHHVSPSPGLVTVSPACFRAQMERLARDGWRSIGTAELEAFFAGQPLPAKSCLITFDDGYLDNFVHAHPALAELGLQALLFVVTGWLGDGPARQAGDCPDHGECKRRIAAGDADSVVMRWSEAEAMQAAGVFEFHSHTHSHARWDKEIADTQARRAALAADLAQSRAALAGRLGVASRHLCWPQGYYDAQYLAVAGEAGFDHLYTTEVRINRPGGATHRIGRFVTKERPGDWLEKRTRLYANPWLGGIYSAFRRA